MNLQGTMSFESLSYLVLCTRISQRSLNVRLSPLLHSSLVLKYFIQYLPQCWDHGSSVPPGLTGRSAMEPGHMNLAFTCKSKCATATTLACTPLGWQTTPKCPEFLWRIPAMWVHPTVSIHGKPSCVGWRRTPTCSNTQPGGRA